MPPTMILRVSAAFAYVMMGVCANAADSTRTPPPFVPMPQQVILDTGESPLSSASRILFDTREATRPIERSLEAHAKVLSGEVELLTGLRLPSLPLKGREVQDGDIVLRFEAMAKPISISEEDEDQSYELRVDGHLEVISKYTKGIAYGTATLIQALRISGDRFTVPNMIVRDAPASAFRTVMIDVARRPHSIGTLKDVIRLARLYKLRYVHLHLTDDQNFTFPFAPVTEHVENNACFTRQELQDLVRYAEARGITLIPEFDLPGHSGVLRRSGYLSPSETDADVADPKNAAKIHAIIDDMLSIFHTSPYFHIGGDESSAGSALVPFLVRVQKHLRGKPASEQRRLIVWEGFHGAPEGLPATGPDHIVVVSWESSYNPPWALLDAGYTVINGSWKPLYAVGHGTPRHPGASTRMWSPEVLFSWDKDLFMHWEPGRPVFEDRGPNDPTKDDSTWSAAYIGKESQVIGGQLLLWEQEEQWVTKDLRNRIPVVAARLWNPTSPSNFAEYEKAFHRIDERIMSIVRPVEILPQSSDPNNPATLDFRLYEGESVEVELRNRTRIEGEIRFNTGGVSNDLNWIVSNKIPEVDAKSDLYTDPIEIRGGRGIRARLFRPDGTAIDGTNWQAFQNWPARVQVTDYDFGHRQLREVPDLSKHNEKISRTYVLPMLRGPFTHIDNRAQRFDATLVIDKAGTYVISAKTQSGRATVYLDRSNDGNWEAVIRDTPTSEELVSTEIELSSGAYPLRVDHAAGLPRPVVLVYLTAPGGKREEISRFLRPLGQ